MLLCWRKKPIILDKNISELCKKSTQDSMKKLTNKHTLERYKKINNELIIVTNPNNNVNNFFYWIMAFLSIPTITFIFYKTNK